MKSAQTPNLEVACSFSDCFACCKDTRMPLLKEDIARIVKKGYALTDFTVMDDGFIVLRNKDSYCVFLKEGRCSIYSIRPIGCRLYPLVYDIDNDEPIIDKECAHPDAFLIKNIPSPVLDLLEKTVDTLIRERNQRARKKQDT